MSLSHHGLDIKIYKISVFLWSLFPCILNNMNPVARRNTRFHKSVHTDRWIDMVRLLWGCRTLITMSRQYIRLILASIPADSGCVVPCWVSSVCPLDFYRCRSSCFIRAWVLLYQCLPKDEIQVNISIISFLMCKSCSIMKLSNAHLFVKWFQIFF